MNETLLQQVKDQVLLDWTCFGVCFFLILILLLFQTAVSANGTARESAVPKVWYTCRIYLGGGKGTHGE